MSRGTFIAVVGPSGSGKDTLMRAAIEHRADLVSVRRVISRPPSPGTEDYESVSANEFTSRRDAGAFALHWEAHGLDYGVPTEIEDALADGRHVLANLSRGAVPAARARFGPFLCIAVTASADVLARRLAGRGRETAEEIEGRLARAAYPVPEGADVHVVDNSGPLQEGLAAFVSALPSQPVSA